MGVGLISVVLALDLDLTSGLDDIDSGDPIGLTPLPNANRSTAGGSRIKEIVSELEHGRRF